MCYQGLQIQHSMGEQPHRRRPRVMVPVDEFEVDLNTKSSAV